MIKIIGGRLKNRYLDTKRIDRNITRPSQAILRKSVFELLGEISDSIVLDLFCGSGIMGIEAISRGAKKVYFIDKEKENIKILKENLINLDIEKNAEVFHTDYRMAIKALYKREIKPDYIFIDPPHKWVEKFNVLDYIIKYNILNDWTFIIHQMYFATNINTDNYKVITSKRHGKTKFLLLKKEKK